MVELWVSSTDLGRILRNATYFSSFLDACSVEVVQYSVQDFNSDFYSSQVGIKYEFDEYHFHSNDILSCFLRAILQAG